VKKEFSIIDNSELLNYTQLRVTYGHSAVDSMIDRVEFRNLNLIVESITT
jgi:hypothetical protein